MLLAAISDSIEQAFSNFFGWLPNLLGALAILVIGWIVAKVLAKLVSKGLQRIGLDRTLQAGTGGQWISKVTSSPSRLLGTVAFWAVMLGAISLAVSVLGIPALTAFMAAVYGYLPHVVAALVIFLVASAIAAGVATLARRTMGDTPTGRVVATVAPGVVMAIAIFMILTELQIAESIVLITYAALIGSLALAAALAFGLGGRDVAGRMLQGAYEAGQRNRDQVRRDLEQGKERARADAERAREKTRDKAEGDEVSGPPSREPVFQPDPALTAETTRSEGTTRTS